MIDYIGMLLQRVNLCHCVSLPLTGCTSLYPCQVMGSVHYDVIKLVVPAYICKKVVVEVMLNHGGDEVCTLSIWKQYTFITVTQLLTQDLKTFKFCLHEFNIGTVHVSWYLVSFYGVTEQDQQFWLHILVLEPPD